jgi:acyl carrier protein
MNARANRSSKLLSFHLELEVFAGMLDRVREIIADITKNSIENINENSSHKDVDGWDSVAQINIVVTIEMDFGVSFNAEEIHSLNSVRKIMHALKSAPVS